MRRVTAGERAYQISSALLMCVLLALMFVPILYIISTSITPREDALKRGIYVIYPSNPTLVAYARLLLGGWVQQALLVSVARTAIGVALTLSITTIGAFCLSRKLLPGRRLFLLLILVTLLVGGGLIPTYLLFRNLGLINTFWVYIIPGLVDAWGLLVIKQFMELEPVELEEAARMDGAGQLQILARVVVPLSTPVLAAIGLFEAVGAWNSWTDSLIYVSDGKLWSFQYVLRNMLQRDIQGFAKQSQQDTASAYLLTATTTETLKMAAVVIGTLPILCVYPFLQKYFTKGMLTGSIKG